MNSTHTRQLNIGVAAVIALAGSAASIAHGQAWNNPAGGAWGVAANWNPMAVPSGAGASAVIGLPGTYTVTTTTLAVGEVDIPSALATLAVLPGNGFQLINAAVNQIDGTIIVNSTGSFSGTNMQIAAPGTQFVGSGVIRLNSSTSDPSTGNGTAWLLSAAAGAGVVVGPNFGIVGFGRINGLDSTINGRIDADIAGRLLLVAGGNHQNNGLLTASNGGTLQVQVNTLTQGPGGSIAPSNGTVLLVGGTVTGGSIISTGANRVQVASAGTIFDDVTISGGVDQYNGFSAGIGAGGIVLNPGATFLVNVPGAFSGTSLRSTGAVTPVGGSGTIRLNSSTSDPSVNNGTAWLTGDANTSWLFGDQVTVAGFGRIYAVPTTNNGQVLADVTGRPLAIVGSTHQNNDRYAAVNGGVLSISAGVSQSAAGVIEAVGANDTTNSTVQISNAVIAGGTVRSTGPARTQLNQGVVFDQVTVQDGVDLNPGNVTRIDTGLTLAGGATVLLNTTGAFSGTRIVTDGAGTQIAGTGTIRLNASISDPAANNGTADLLDADGTPGGSFVFAPGITVAGFGRIVGLPTTNNGTVDADIPGRPLRIEGGAPTNNNLYRSSNGGQLILVNAPLTQSPTASTIAGNGSFVTLVNSSITGGTLGSTLGGVAETVGSVGLASIDVSRQLNVNPGSATDVGGSGMDLVDNALIVVNPSGSFNGTRISAGAAPAVISGTGTIRLNASPSDPTANNGTADLAANGGVTGSAFLFGPGVTVDGFGRFANVPTTNNGLVHANVNGRPVRIDSATHQNNAQYRASGGGLLQLVNTTVNQSGGGSFVAQSGSFVQLSGATINGGLFDTFDSGLVQVTASSTVSGVTTDASLHVLPGTVLAVGTQPLVNTGTITVNPTGSFSGTRIGPGGAAAAINGSGVIVLRASPSDPSTNNGTADLGTNGSTLTIGQSQVVTGRGRLIGTTVLDGVLSPGEGPDVVSFLRNNSVLSMGNTGALRIEAVSNASVDSIANFSSFALNGTLVMSATHDPAPGTTFDIINGGTITGGFDSIQSIGLSAPKRFGARVDPGRVRVTVLCGLADVGGVGADANGDGSLDNNDFVVFVDLFFANSPLADFGATGGVPGADGVWDNNDFIVFIDYFFAGCP